MVVPNSVLPQEDSEPPVIDTEELVWLIYPFSLSKIQTKKSEGLKDQQWNAIGHGFNEFWCYVFFKFAHQKDQKMKVCCNKTGSHSSPE